MRRLVLPLLVVALLTASFATTAAQPTAAPPLRLHRAILAKTSNRATTQALATPPSSPYAIVQFSGPIGMADRAALERTGVAVLSYLPDFAYLVRGNTVQLAAAAQVPHVVARVPFTAADKFAPALLRALARGDSQVGRVHVVGWPASQGQVGPSLQTAGLNVDVALSTGDLLRVAALPAVRWIEPAGQPRLLNDVAREIMHVGSAWQSRGLYGDGQIVAVADSGLDTGNSATLSSDFAGRVKATHALAIGGDIEDEYGHGTHVAGSIAGSGAQSGAKPDQLQYAGSFAGVAPRAQLVVQAFEADSNGAVSGLDPDYYKLFAQAYADGARLHSDSWGDYTGPSNDAEAIYGGYPYGSQRTDQFLWEHPDMAIFSAAGNSGADGTPGTLGFCTGGDGVVDADSLLMPGTAKNVITVGASESQRSSGGLSTLPWLLLNFCFAAQPIASDTTSNNPNGMAGFSSRGPTDDGRAKPDIVAPGTNIVSAKSHAVPSAVLWGDYETNPNYAYSGGTSMATPLVAGAGALARQWLTTRGVAQPSGAAVKATLLNTAANMAPGQYGTGPTQEIPFARPNSVAGWGRTDLGFVDAPPPYFLWVDDHTQGVATNQTVSYASTAGRPLEVLDSSQPLRIMLTWTDYPADLSAARQLVNDLDLVVKGPGGVTYRGNGVASGDRLNNVEGVVIDNPPVGKYTIEVRGYNVPMASQPYALAVGGPINGTPQLSLTKSANPAQQIAPGGLVTYTLSLSANKAIGQPVLVTDTLPLHTTFVSASDGGTRQGAIVTWSVPSLAAGATVRRTLVVRVDSSVSDGTPIINASYRASSAASSPSAGPPVVISTRASAPELRRPVFVPIAGR
jgi:serine protease AprX